MRRDQINQLLEQLGQALSAGDLRKAWSYWEVPALVLSDEGAIAVSDASEIEKFFAQATEWYRSHGIASTKPEIERVDMLSEKLASVDVRLTSFDASGKEKSSERSHYIVQLGTDEQAHIRVTLTRTKRQTHRQSRQQAIRTDAASASVLKIRLSSAPVNRNVERTWITRET
jgi:hypothetical protein